LRERAEIAGGRARRITAIAAFASLAAIAAGAAAGDRGDAGLDADDARVDALLGAHGPPQSRAPAVHGRSRPTIDRRGAKRGRRAEPAPPRP
jgi:hypothetical protein